MSIQWPPPPPPLPPPVRRLPLRRSWLPAAIIGSAIVIAAGLVAGALILSDRAGSDGTGSDGTGSDGTGTCQAWTQTRQTLRSIPALPQGWNWSTPNIDNYIKIQNAPVGKALEAFEPEITAAPADVAQAARDYVAARRHQMQSLTDRTYVAADGVAVDTALGNLNRLCGIQDNGRPI
jgi:hypothetical protein